MAREEKPSLGQGAVYIGRDAHQNTIVTGNENTVGARYEKVTLPPPESVDIQAELAALRQVLPLVGLDARDARQASRALDDAEAKSAAAQPDKNGIGEALDDVLAVAAKAERFAETTDKLQPHVARAVAWLGENWYKLLGVVGLSV